MPDRSPSIAEIAALIARLLELSSDGRAADPAEVDQFIADKRELLDRIPSENRGGPDPHVVDEAPTLHQHSAVQNRGARQDAMEAADEAASVNDPWSDAAFIEDAARNGDDVGAGDPWADYRVYTPDEAAVELVARGVPPDEAPGRVDRFLDGLQWDGWSPQDQWQIDGDDLDIMLAPAMDGGDMAGAADEAHTFGPSDTELDDMAAQVATARAEGEFWQPAGAREQWRERDEPGEDGRRWELRDVADEPSAVADAYGSTYGTGYDWTAREFDPSAELGLDHLDGQSDDAGPVMSAEAAAHALSEDGRAIDEARADVTRYLDDVSARIGTPAHQWGLDTADLSALRNCGSATADAEAAASGRAIRSYGCIPDRSADPEQYRRDQLSRWHDDDERTTAPEAGADAAINERGVIDGEVTW